MSILSEQPPSSTDLNLSAYLRRVFGLIDVALVNAGKLPVNNLKPPKPVVGKLYYFGVAISDADWNGVSPIIEEGLYVYASEGYRFIV